jgi:hypothetical protein
MVSNNSPREFGGAIVKPYPGPLLEPFGGAGLAIGREALVRQWPLDHLLRSLNWLRSLPDDVLEQMEVPA